MAAKEKPWRHQSMKKRRKKENVSWRSIAAKKENEKRVGGENRKGKEMAWN